MDMIVLIAFIFSMFFDACDGIFLNYNWKDETLHNSLKLAREKGRDMDVYVGIDVFGRGCLGGGGFNTVEVCMDSIAPKDLPNEKYTGTCDVLVALCACVYLYILYVCTFV